MNNDSFSELMDSVKEMDKIVQGKQRASRTLGFPDPKVQTIRHKLGLSQTQFAWLIGVSHRTLENWEQGRRHPTGPARALLTILSADTKHSLRALHHQRRKQA